MACPCGNEPILAPDQPVAQYYQHGLVARRAFYLIQQHLDGLLAHCTSRLCNQGERRAIQARRDKRTKAGDIDLFGPA